MCVGFSHENNIRLDDVLVIENYINRSWKSFTEFVSINMICNCYKKVTEPLLVGQLWSRRPECLTFDKFKNNAVVKSEVFLVSPKFSRVLRD